MAKKKRIEFPGQKIKYCMHCGLVANAAIHNGMCTECNKIDEER